MGALKKPRQEAPQDPEASAPFLWPEAQRRRHAALTRALERLEDLRERIIAKVDQIEGDPDLEPSLGSDVLMDQTRWAEGSPALMAYADLEEQCEGGGGDDACEDEGSACEDEGIDTDKEPDHNSEMCNWADEGDQRDLQALPVFTKRVPGARPSWANLSAERVEFDGPIRLRVSKG